MMPTELSRSSLLIRWYHSDPAAISLSEKNTVTSSRGNADSIAPLSAFAIALLVLPDQLTKTRPGFR